MTTTPDALCYHGRRSIDELRGALNARTPEVAQAHKELSRLHLDRFVAVMASAAEAIRPDSST